MTEVTGSTSYDLGYEAGRDAGYHAGYNAAENRFCPSEEDMWNDVVENVTSCPKEGIRFMADLLKNMDSIARAEFIERLDRELKLWR